MNYLKYIQCAQFTENLGANDPRFGRRLSFYPALAAILILLSSVTANAQKIHLIGLLQTDAKVPVPQTRVVVAGGAEQLTDSRGKFDIALSNEFQVGQRVLISIIKPGWVINSPLDGEWNLPNLRLQKIQTLNVIIVPATSKALWSHERIEKYIAKLSDDSTRKQKFLSTGLAQAKIANARLQEEARPVADFSEYLNRWALEFGQSPDQVKNAFDEWARATESSDDYRKMGLRQFYLKNFAAAANDFVKAALRGEEQIKRDEGRLNKTKLETYEDWKLAGNAQYNDYNFREAINSYNQAAKLVAKDDHPQEWAAIEILIGNAQQQLGNTANGAEGQKLLEAAGNRYRNALAVYTYEQFPQQWAGIQNDLGNALTSQGERAEAQEIARLLDQAAAAYQEALKVYTQKQFPQQWATTQNNLGVTFAAQGEQAKGQEEMKLLDKSAAAYQEALNVHTREQFPQQWARTQNNLGGVLLRQGELAKGRESVRLLGQAEAAYREALQIYTHGSVPQQWAITQNNLGSTLLRKGERVAGKEGVRLLAGAVTAYRESLEVRTRNRMPQQWALTQNNLGLALMQQGQRSEGQEKMQLLADAVVAYRQALEVHTRDQLPRQWAMTKLNLGTALGLQGERMTGQERVRLLNEAVAVLREALQVHTRDGLPQQWALTQSNLGYALYSLEDWENAAEAYRNVLSLYPDHTVAYSRVSGIYHDILYRFQEAYELNRNRLQRHPDDLIARTDFAEKNFTTSNFAECEKLTADLWSMTGIKESSKSALRGIEIANALALGKGKQVEAKLDELITAIVAQPADFKVNWNFAGTLHFVGSHEKLAPYRNWLREIFAALKFENRDAILDALRAARVKMTQYKIQ